MDDRIHPTHTCFDDCAEIIAEIVRYESRKRLSEFRLVHALCTLPTGEAYVHGWIEDLSPPGFSHLKGIQNGERRHVMAYTADYRETLQIQDLRSYTFAEAALLSRKHGGSGPFVPAWRQLCDAARSKVTLPDAMKGAD